ncbi:MAG: DNA-binding protein WhiA [Lachnospiraceae bacterium]
MSFSSEVKEELARHSCKARHCQIAELAAAVSFSGKIKSDEGKTCLEIETENVVLARKYFTLLKKTFNIDTDILIRETHYLNRNKTYTIAVKEEADLVQLFQLLHQMNPDGSWAQADELVSPLIVQQSCCKRAFIRGAFLASGSMSDPEKSYHFEIVCNSEKKAEQMQKLMNTFDVDAKIVQRKKNFVVYLKEGAQIVEMLNVMEAHVALMNLENVRIIKEMRNSVNRQVNCETANINKTVHAAVKQLDDIQLIQQTRGLDSLPDGLKETAHLRLEYPEATLKELGTLFTPPIGKSGVNHRLRRLSELAEEIRSRQESVKKEEKT